MSSPKFIGNCPHNVSKDAKYTIRSGENGPLVTIIYDTGQGEIWYPSTDEHPKLVEMVNEVKREHSAGLNGSFYLNEYHQVIVPVIGDDNYYLAGTYSEPLKFEFEGKIISGESVDLDGNPISPGDVWPGPHAGIPYLLKAGGKDIYYKLQIRPNVIKKVFLSEEISRGKASITASLVCAHKGVDGGRFYVNEFGCIFSPLEKQEVWEYTYIGRLDMQNWFPKPPDANSGDS